MGKQWCNLSTDKIGALELLPLREAVFLFAKRNAPHQECHVAGQGAHGLSLIHI